MGVFTSFYLSSFNRTSSQNAKSVSELLPPADFAVGKQSAQQGAKILCLKFILFRVKNNILETLINTHSHAIDICGLWYPELVLVELGVAYSGKDNELTY